VTRHLTLWRFLSWAAFGLSLSRAVDGNWLWFLTVTGFATLSAELTYRQGKTEGRSQLARELFELWPRGDGPGLRKP
jgi:hypothetical protein